MFMNERRRFMKYAFSAAVVSQAAFIRARADGTVMAPGKSKIIQITQWDHQHWTASLKNVASRVSIEGRNTVTTDPDFHLVGPDPSTSAHDEAKLEYIGWDNVNWSSKCIAHTNIHSGLISFTFAHYKEGESTEDHSDHEIHFTAWDGTPWIATAPTIGPMPDGKTLEVIFDLRTKA
jgi:hypothetical protein